MLVNHVNLCVLCYLLVVSVFCFVFLVSVITIAKKIDTEVGILRLRSVCKTWRSKVRPLLRPSPFPLKVPPFSHHTDPILPGDGHYFLNYTTLYRLSPPTYSGDPSEGWLIRVSEVRPNRFLLRTPLLSRRFDFALGTFPKFLNLLDHRITQVSKVYTLEYLDSQGYVYQLNDTVKKVVVVRNQGELDCDFAVVSLYTDHVMRYWRFGDNAWSPICTQGYRVNDIVVYEGKCYAIGINGVVCSLDPEFILRGLPLISLPRPQNSIMENFLVEYKSELYAVSEMRGYNAEISMYLVIFKKCNNRWERTRCLGNHVLLCSDDVCIGVSSENFRGRGANCAYIHRMGYVACYVCDEGHRIFRLDKDKNVSIKYVQECALYWPPPGWLMEIARDN